MINKSMSKNFHKAYGKQNIFLNLYGSFLGWKDYWIDRLLWKLVQLTKNKRSFHNKDNFNESDSN